ncbi:hypothetical protein KCU67_g10629, partial [Aureobasidium melanogenum]
LLIIKHDNKDTLSIHIRSELLDPVSRNHGFLEIMADHALIKQKCLDEVKAVIDKIMQSLDSDDETDASDGDTAQYQHAETMGTADESHVAAVDELNERHQAELQDFFEQSNNNQAQQLQSNDIVAQRPESSAISPSGGERPEKRKADSSPAISAQTKRHKSAHHSQHYERQKKTHHWEPSKELVAALDRLMLPRAASSGFDTAVVAYAQHYLWHLIDGFL